MESDKSTKPSNWQKAFWGACGAICLAMFQLLLEYKSGWFTGAKSEPVLVAMKPIQLMKSTKMSEPECIAEVSKGTELTIVDRQRMVFSSGVSGFEMVYVEAQTGPHKEKRGWCPEDLIEMK